MVLRTGPDSATGEIDIGIAAADSSYGVAMRWAAGSNQGAYANCVVGGEGAQFADLSEADAMFANQRVNVCYGRYFFDSARTQLGFESMAFELPVTSGAWSTPPASGTAPISLPGTMPCLACYVHYRRARM